MIPAIPRTAKDTIQKMLAEMFQGGLTEWLGIPDIHLVGTMASAVPTLAFGDKVLDQVFLTEREEIINLEFQSNKEHNLFRFLTYSTALAVKHLKPVRTIVLYLTVNPPARDHLELHSIRYNVENVFVSIMAGDEVWERVGPLMPNDWTDRDVLDLVFYPFMQSVRPLKERAIRAANLANTIPGSKGRLACAAILGLTSRFVDEEVVDLIKEVIRMRDLVSELEDEAIQRGWTKGLEEGMEQGLKQGREQGLEQGLEQGRKEGLKVGIREGIFQSRLQVVRTLTAHWVTTPSDAMLESLQDLGDEAWGQLLVRLSSMRSVEEFETVVASLLQ